jgi:hypothetical protein
VDPVVSPPSNRDLDETMALLAAVQASLARVAPGVTLEYSQLSVILPAEGGRHVRVYGLVRVGGRIGAMNTIAWIDPEPLTCDDFESCHIGPGRCGSTVRRVEFERRVPRGTPRNLEIRVVVRGAGNAQVDVSLNNASELYEAGGPPVPHTGQDPPLSLAQLADFAQDPALNVLARAPAGACG